jgi:hypothetical protein
LAGGAAVGYGLSDDNDDFPWVGVGWFATFFVLSSSGVWCRLED